MALDDLLTALESTGAVTPVTRCNPGEVTAKPLPNKAVTRVTPVTPKTISTENLISQPAVAYRWLVRFLDRDPLEVTCSPEASRAEVEGWYPTATGAEPVLDPSGDAFWLVPQWLAPKLAHEPRAEPVPDPSGDALPALTGEDESNILAWLDAIGETDPVTRGEVIDGCRAKAETRDYFAGRAKHSK